MSVFDQSDYDVRFEWGEQGLKALAAITDVLVIVDVLSFSTATEIAVSSGAVVLPFPSRDEAAAAAFAAQENALLAGPRQSISSTTGTTKGPFSLSPASLQHIPSGTRMVLPSPKRRHPQPHRRGTRPHRLCRLPQERVSRRRGRPAGRSQHRGDRRGRALA